MLTLETKRTNLQTLKSLFYLWEVLLSPKIFSSLREDIVCKVFTITYVVILYA